MLSKNTINRSGYWAQQPDAIREPINTKASEEERLRSQQMSVNQVKFNSQRNTNKKHPAELPI